MTKVPPYLKHGDKIAIAASARKVSPAEMQPSIDLFTSWGLEVVTSDELYAAQNQFAGSDALRASNLQGYLDDDNIRAIIFARGGYGTVRLVDSLDFSHFQSQPKWLVGYSDITVLHSHVHRHADVSTLHAPMSISMQAHNADHESLAALRHALFGEPISYEWPGALCNRKGSAKGQIVGGNLSVLYSLMGSNSDIDTTRKILFLEDLDEYLYHVDRMMMNLKRGGKLRNLAGLIIGGMSDMKDNTIPFGSNAEEIIADNVAEFHFPVAFGFPAGHEKKNLSMRFGCEATLQVEDQHCLLTF